MSGGLLPVGFQFLGGPVLLGLRVGGLVMTAPMLAARVVPLRVRVAIGLILTAALAPIAATGTHREVTPTSLFSETIIGGLIGLSATLMIGAAETAGEWLAVQMGLAGAATVNPVSAESTPVLGQFMALTATALLVVTDGHLVMLDALAASVAALPLGEGIDLAGGLTAALALGSELMMAGLRFAAPGISALLLVNVGLGILARTVPQLNLLMVAFPVQIGIGLAALAFGLPFAFVVFGSWDIHYEALLGTVLTSFLPGGR